MSSNAMVARGSLADLLTTENDIENIAEAFVNVKLILVCDRSASMSARDAGAGENEVRAAVEDAVVGLLQAKHPGKILLVAFGEKVQPRVNGILPEPSGSTPMLEALKVTRQYLASDMHVILLSDGEPTDAANAEILEYAEKHFKNQMDTAFCGRAGSSGQLFLRDLSRAVNGKHHVNVLTETNILPEMVTRLLGEGVKP